MNFLGHYYFAEHDLNSPFYCLGLIYPDLRMKKPSNPPAEFSEGLQEHYSLDKKTHTSIWFAKAKQEVIANTEIGSRTGIIHCAIEIAIDYHLATNGLIKTHTLDLIASNLSSDKIAQFLDDQVPECTPRIRWLVDNAVFHSYQTREGSIQGLERLYNRSKRVQKNGKAFKEKLPMIFDVCSEYVAQNAKSLYELLE